MINPSEILDFDYDTLTPNQLRFIRGGKTEATEGDLARTDTDITELQNDLSKIAKESPRIKGACSGLSPDIFYPERGYSTEPAKKICRMCASIEYCLDYAIANNENFGVWGGMSERERRKLRREQGLIKARKPKKFK